MHLLHNIRLLYKVPPDGGQSETGSVPDAAIAWDESGIIWAGPESEVPKQFKDAKKHDAGGCIVIPGLVDCHTHLAFGGWRADEFHLRNQGVSYQEIARSGGGIRRTMEQTRETSADNLIDYCRSHLKQMLHYGVTTVECKTGYGLSFDEEIKLLNIYKAITDESRQQIIVTLLAAHTVPPEYVNDRETYIRVVEELIKLTKKQNLAAFCDVFVEEGAFSMDESRHILNFGKKHGLIPKLHADQLSDGGGAELAAEVGAISADHLEYISDKGINALQKSGTVAVSLPLASLYLRQKPLPARKIIDSGVRVAVATDFNPGSAPSHHLPLAMHLACVMQQMSAHEVLKGATAYAAAACGASGTGSIQKGYRADFALLDTPNIEHWMYHFRENVCSNVVLDGKFVNRDS